VSINFVNVSPIIDTSIIIVRISFAKLIPIVKHMIQTEDVLEARVIAKLDIKQSIIVKSAQLRVHTIIIAV